MRGSCTHSYRADIDGLRALAVLLVLVFHAFPKHLRGGYLGVDIFFVISGFLISTITLTEMKEGRFSLWRFYARRVRRIFPALLLVLVATLGLGWLLLLPEEYRSLGHSGAAGAAFVPNVLAWLEMNYFGRSAPLVPLLHLWSLGVEEQFYLVWPLLLLVAAGLRVGVALLLLPLLACSFWLALHSPLGGLQDSFYLVHYRGWELMLGCLLGWLSLAHGPRLRELFGKRAALLFGLLSLAGALLVAYGVGSVPEGKNLYFPSLVPVVLGTALLILAGRDALLNRTFFALPAIVALGKISYPLYLWHWPLFSYSHYLNSAGPPWAHVLAIALAFPLAAATYLLVEKPIKLHPARVELPLVACMALVGFFGWLASVGKVEPRSASLSFGNVMVHRDWNADPGRMQHPYRGGNYMHVGDGQDLIVMVGDSFAQHYWPRLVWLTEQAPGGAQAARMGTRPGCNAAQFRLSDGHAGCKTYLEGTLDFIDAPEVKQVVVVGLWPFLQPRETGPHLERHARAVEDYLREIRMLGKRVVLVSGSPYSARFELPGVLRRKLWGAWETDGSGMPRSDWAMRADSMREWLEPIARSTGADFVDPTDFLCNREICPSLDEEGRRIYADHAHLARQFVRERVTYLDRYFQVRPERGQTARGLAGN